MTIIATNDGTNLSRRAWLQALRVEEHDLQSLIDQKIIRQIDDGRFKLSFVGIVIFRHTVLLGLPKYCSTSDFDSNTLIRVLRHYFLRSSARRSITDQHLNPEYGDERVLREFDSLSALIDWFSVHGWYRHTKARISNFGRPHWSRTLTKRQPIISDETVVYPDVISQRRDEALNEVSALQASILARLMERYGFKLPQEILSAELHNGFVIHAWPPSSLERAFYRRFVESEARTVFQTEKLRLLSMLSSVLDSTLAAPDQRPQVFGTTAFHAVWEDACKSVIGQDIPYNAIARIGQPKWTVKNSASNDSHFFQAQIPDLMAIKNDVLFIMDAKYYFPFPESRPGGPDIIKQIYYSEALSAGSPTKVRSLFLLPHPKTEAPQFLGYATIDGSLRSFELIEAWGINPNWLFSCYVSHSYRHTNDFIDAAFNSGDDVAKFIAQTPGVVGA